MPENPKQQAQVEIEKAMRAREKAAEIVIEKVKELQSAVSVFDCELDVLVNYARNLRSSDKARFISRLGTGTDASFRLGELIAESLQMKIQPRHDYLKDKIDFLNYVKTRHHAALEVLSQKKNLPTGVQR